MLASFMALLVLVWRMNRQPCWRVRAVIYGWGASFLWALLWALLLPMWFRGFMDADTLRRTFPDGTLAVGFLFGGWFWPLIVAGCVGYRERAVHKESADDQIGVTPGRIEIALLAITAIWYCAFIVLFTSGKNGLDRIPWPWLIVLTFVPVLSAGLAIALHLALQKRKRGLRLLEILLVVFVVPQFLGAAYVWLGVFHYL